MKPARLVLTALVVASSAVVAAAQPADEIFKDGFEAICGNAEIEPGEDCDGSDLGAETCVGLGFVSGTLACTPSCTFDTSACSNCGNGVADAGERLRRLRPAVRHGPDLCRRVRLRPGAASPG